MDSLYHDYSDKFVMCPYNPQHIMKKSRLITHLSRGCAEKKMYGHFFKVCPWNALHIVKAEEIIGHMSNCCDQRNFQEEKKKETASKPYGKGDKQAGRESLSQFTGNKFDPWDLKWPLDSEEVPRSKADNSIFVEESGRMTKDNGEGSMEIENY